jgi:hypothetical protein
VTGETSPQWRLGSTRLPTSGEGTDPTPSKSLHTVRQSIPDLAQADAAPDLPLNHLAACRAKRFPLPSVRLRGSTAVYVAEPASEVTLTSHTLDDQARLGAEASGDLTILLTAIQT